MGNKDGRRRRASKKRLFNGNRYTGSISKVTRKKVDLGPPQASSSPARTHDDEEGPPQSEEGTSAEPEQQRMEPEPTATARKLNVSNEAEEHQPDNNTAAAGGGDEKSRDESYILINMSVLQEIINIVGKCPVCMQQITVSNLLTKKKGFANLLQFECSNCKWNHELYSSTKIGNKSKAGPKSFEVNTRLVLAFREIGRGLSALESFARCMNMPNCINRTPYDNINKALGQSYAEVAQDSRKNAAKELIEILGGGDENGIAECHVSVDGSWQKRGYSSLNGVVTLFSKDTGKCLDTQVMSKICKGCQHWEKKKGTQEYEQWKNEHNCSINHTQSSGNMEAAGAIEIFKRSVPHLNLQYTGYIGDGDTKAHQSVVDAKPYGDKEIVKLECIGHVQKRMGTRLRNLVRDKRGQKLSDGKGISGKNRLTKKIINAMQNYYGMAIRQNTTNLYAMKKSIIAILFHCSENKDMDDRHKFCPRTKESWCKYQSDKLTKNNSYKPSITIPSAVKEVLGPIFTDLSKDDLLKKCLHGKTQNVNEALHGVIWQKCPKQVHTSRAIVEIGVNAAVVTYNDGCMGVNRVLKKLGVKPGKFMIMAGKRKNLKRLNDSLRSSSEKGKKRRKKLRSHKKHYEDKEKEQEGGESYSCGSF